MRRRLTVVFIAIVTAFVGLDAVVLLALRPAAQRAETLGEERAAAAKLIAEMHGALHAMSLAATRQFVQLRAVDGDDAALRAARSAYEDAASRMELYAREYGATRLGPRQAERWREFTSQRYPAFTRTAEQVANAAASNEVRDDLELRVLGETSNAAEEILQQLAHRNAEVIAEETRGLHDYVRKLALACVALGALGLVSCVLLVRWALHAVQAYERSMQERLEELDTFAGRVAHDLRNPLQTIAMSLAVIRQRVSDERAIATCGKAQESVKRASQFIQELLVFARSGAKPAPGARASVEQVLRAVASDLAAQAQQARVSLRVDPARDLEAAISPEALHAIVANLADNAMKAMPPDRVERVVEISSRAVRGAIEVHVRDTGRGISAEALPRLFDGHYRATSRSDGHGIGLTTVKRLAESHGGYARATSEEGRGSHFTVTLPAARPLEAPSQAPVKAS